MIGKIHKIKYVALAVLIVSTIIGINEANLFVLVGLIIVAILWAIYEVRSQKYDLFRLLNISFILGVVSLVVFGLCFSFLVRSSEWKDWVGGGLFLDRSTFLVTAFIGGPVATIMSVTGLVFGIKWVKGVRSKYTKRGRAIKGIILCVIGIILGIFMSFVFVILNPQLN